MNLIGFFKELIIKQSEIIEAYRQLGTPDEIDFVFTYFEMLMRSLEAKDLNNLIEQSYNMALETHRKKLVFSNQIDKLKKIVNDDQFLQSLEFQFERGQQH